MNKEYTLTKESIEYWKEEFRYMAEKEITFKEFILGEAGSGPTLDASLGMCRVLAMRDFVNLPEDEKKEIAQYRYYEAFPSQIAASVGISKDELLNMTADEFAARF